MSKFAKPVAADAPPPPADQAEKAPPSPHPHLDAVLAKTTARCKPADYTPDFCTDVVRVMGEGFSLTAFAGAIDASRKMIEAWIAAEPAFAAAVERGRAARTRALEMQFLTAGTGAKVSAHVFALRNAAPEDWRERPDAEAKVLPNITFVLNGQEGDAELARLDAPELVVLGRDDGR
ncbi:MAG: hypothetical protein ACYDD1_07085 [Caulobacteraceae bacterium]